MLCDHDWEKGPRTKRMCHCGGRTKQKPSNLPPPASPRIFPCQLRRSALRSEPWETKDTSEERAEGRKGERAEAMTGWCTGALRGVYRRTACLRGGGAPGAACTGGPWRGLAWNAKRSAPALPPLGLRCGDSRSTPRPAPIGRTGLLGRYRRCSRLRPQTFTDNSSRARSGASIAHVTSGASKRFLPNAKGWLSRR